jgi:hypothetical protein
MVCLASAFLVHFGMIVKYKQVLIHEPNIYILWLEIVLITAIMVFGIVNMVKLIRKGD